MLLGQLLRVNSWFGQRRYACWREHRHDLVDLMTQVGEADAAREDAAAARAFAEAAPPTTGACNEGREHRQGHGDRCHRDWRRDVVQLPVDSVGGGQQEVTSAARPGAPASVQAWVPTVGCRQAAKECVRLYRGTGRASGAGVGSVTGAWTASCTYAASSPQKSAAAHDAPRESSSALTSRSSTGGFQVSGIGVGSLLGRATDSRGRVARASRVDRPLQPCRRARRGHRGRTLWRVHSPTRRSGRGLPRSRATDAGASG